MQRVLQNNTIQNRLILLNTLEFFTTYHPQTKHKIAQHLELFAYSKKDILYKQAQSAQSIYINLMGEIQLTVYYNKKLPYPEDSILTIMKKCNIRKSKQDFNLYKNLSKIYEKGVRTKDKKKLVIIAREQPFGLDGIFFGDSSSRIHQAECRTNGFAYVIKKEHLHYPQQRFDKHSVIYCKYNTRTREQFNHQDNYLQNFKQPLLTKELQSTLNTLDLKTTRRIQTPNPLANRALKTIQHYKRQEVQSVQYKKREKHVARARQNQLKPNSDRIHSGSKVLQVFCGVASFRKSLRNVGFYLNDVKKQKGEFRSNQLLVSGIMEKIIKK